MCSISLPLLPGLSMGQIELFGVQMTNVKMNC